MVDRATPRLFTIPAHRAFADALAVGLIRRFGRDPLELARGLVLLPNNRAKRTVTEAFVRASGGGLLLPRMVAIGDMDQAEAPGLALDAAGASDPVPPAITAMARRMILARLVAEEKQAIGMAIDAAEAVRMAGELAHALDQLLVEEVPPGRLREITLSEALSVHWQRSLQMFGIVLDRWPDELKQLGMIDLAERRRRLLDRLGQHWLEDPPRGFVCAAGITTSAPAIARLIRVVAGLDQGLIIFPDLAIDMDEAEWQALGPHTADPVTGYRKRSIETHPQFQLKLLLDRMGFNRSEVSVWRDSGGHDATAQRGRAIANALVPAEFTAKWTTLPSEARRLSGVALAELPTSADEAQAIALKLREVLETPGKTAALVTPDRLLARRVAAHCIRWQIDIDDSAGRPLSILPSGTFLTALAEAAAQRFAPLALLALLKHPLVCFGTGRLGWLEGVRILDRLLRGPRPAAGLIGIDALLHNADIRLGPELVAVRRWWVDARAGLSAIESAFDSGPQPLAVLVAAIRETAQAICGDALWSGVAGRSAADLLSDLEEQALLGPPIIDPASLSALLRLMLEETSVRMPQGGHPRLAIYGLIEARLQTADLMILGGLNEGVWPGQPAPDPWLAPRIRIELGLPALERRIGLAAHDLASALGAPEVLITRARRDGGAPTIASRFLFRLEAMSGGIARADALEKWVRVIDDPIEYTPASRPAPAPALALRRPSISVTDVDRLKADPFAFYAKHILRLRPLDPVDADASAAWRGTAVHSVLEAWATEDKCAPDKLHPRALAMLYDERTHPMMRALWQPRLMEAIDWIAREMMEQAESGRSVIAAERKGMIKLAGVTLTGKFDRLDRLTDGRLVIIDYKTGKAPSSSAVRAGYSLQLGLLGLIAERGGFEGIAGDAGGFEYWSLARGKDGFGQITSPVHPSGDRNKIKTDDFTSISETNFIDAAKLWLTGDEPFTAKLVSEYAPYTDYDQLMRRDEWYGRD